jgi:hypothetical protein
MPHDTLNICVFKLRITYCNCHHFTLEKIIHMVGKFHPTLHAFDMIKHDLNHLEVATKLHPLH